MLRWYRQLLVEIQRSIVTSEAAKHRVNWLIKESQCWTGGGGLISLLPFLHKCKWSRLKITHCVSSWLSRRGNSTMLLQVQKRQQSSPAAWRSLPPLNDRQRSHHIDSFGCVELISHFRCRKYLHTDYSAVIILHNFVLLPPVTLY